MWPSDAAGQRRLRAVQPGGRTAQVLQFGNGLEVAQVAQVHRKSPMDESEEIIDWTTGHGQRTLPRESPRTHSSTGDSMHAFRRLLLALAASAFASSAYAQAWPSKPIRLVVPFPPGGATDNIARATSQGVAAVTGWSFVFDNRPGAGGSLGMEVAASRSCAKSSATRAPIRPAARLSSSRR
jgi:hypothetical protein